jgi:hypothetical protein
VREISRFLVSIYFSLLVVLCGCGGGGGGGSTPTQPTQPTAPTPSFTMAVSPTSASIGPGGTTLTTITVTAANGFTGTVSVAVAGLPTGVTISPTSPVSVTAGTPVAVTFTAASNTPAGNATVTFAGTSGSATAQNATLTLTVTAPVAAFSLQGDASGLSVGPGQSGTMTVNVVAVSGSNSTAPVTLTFTGSDGITGTFNPATVAIGSTSVLTTTVDPGLIPPFFTNFTITGTGGGATATLPIANVLVPIGGGTMTFNITDLPSGDSASETYIQNFTQLVTSHGGIYDVCGMASSNQVVELRYDPSNPHGFYFDGGYDSSSNRMHPVIHFGSLPNPGSDGTDYNGFDHPLVHELSNALRGALAAGKAKSGNFNVADRAELDPWAENCADDVLRFLNAQGRASAAVYEDFDAMLFFDPFTTYLTPNEMAGNSQVPGYDIGFQYPGSGAYFLLVGPNGFTSDADYQNKYFAALNGLGRLFDPGELQAFHNANATIDGVKAGDFLFTRFPVMYSAPTAVAGPILIPLAYRPQIPQVATVVAMQRDQTPPTTETATDVTSGPISLTATSVSGSNLGTITSDLANSGFGNPVTLGFDTLLSDGNFNFTATWFAADGTTVIKSKSFVLCNVPFADVGSITNATIGPPLGFVVAIHSADKSAAGFTFHSSDVTEGTMTFTAPGVIVVKAGASGEITVKGNKYTIPLVPGSTNGGYGRIIYLPID